MTRRRWVAYVAIVRCQLSTLMHFRANLIAWLVYSPLQLGSVFLLWTIVYQGRADVGGLSFESMMQYYVVVHVLRKILEPAQTVNYEVWSEINQGRLDVYLARPIDFGAFIFAKSLGTPLLEALIAVPFLLLFSILLDLPLPSNPLVVVMFGLSMCAGYLVLFLIQLSIGTLTFWMERIFGIRDILFSLSMLLSGQLLPLSLLPEGVRAMSTHLPFEAIYYIPAQIYGASEMSAAVLALFARQVFWVVTMTAVASLLWTRGVARYASQGG